MAALIADPAFYLGLGLPDLTRPQLLEQHDAGSDAMVRLRYEFEGTLDPIAQRLVGSSRSAWIQEVHVDRSAGSGSLRFEAEQDPGDCTVPPRSS